MLFFVPRCTRYLTIFFFPLAYIALRVCNRNTLVRNTRYLIILNIQYCWCMLYENELLENIYIF